MYFFIAFIVKTVEAILTVVEICFFIRAILSWFPLSDSNPILTFTCMVTEPVIIPFRALFDKLGWFQNVPLDVPFICGILTVGVIDSFLLL